MLTKPISSYFNQFNDCLRACQHADKLRFVGARTLTLYKIKKPVNRQVLYLVAEAGLEPAAFGL